MPSSKKPSTPDSFAFLSGLQSLLGQLPTETHRQEAQATFDKVILFFTDLREKFSALPTREDAADIQQSLSRLEALLREAEKSPAIAQSVGIGQKPKKTAARATPAKEIEVDVSRVVETIKRLTADEIKNRLDSKEFSASAVKQIALALGMKPASKATKPVLVGQIVNYIENARMSDRLAGRTNSEWLSAEQESASTS